MKKIEKVLPIMYNLHLDTEDPDCAFDEAGDVYTLLKDWTMCSICGETVRPCWFRLEHNETICNKHIWSRY